MVPSTRPGQQRARSSSSVADRFPRSNASRLTTGTSVSVPCLRLGPDGVLLNMRINRRIATIGSNSSPWTPPVTRSRGPFKLLVMRTDSIESGWFITALGILFPDAVGLQYAGDRMPFLCVSASISGSVPCVADAVDRWEVPASSDGHHRLARRTQGRWNWQRTASKRVFRTPRSTP